LENRETDLMLTEDYYGFVQKAFDSASEAYDQEEDQNFIRRIMRIYSLEHLRRTFCPGQRILEIGCGTGTEAIQLAKSGIEVVATDISPKMIAYARRRVRGESLTDRINLEQVAAHDIGMLDEEYGSAFFDGAYSSFGALNCEPHLDQFVSSLAGLLKPRSSFVCSVMNKFCLFDCALNSLLFKRNNRLTNVCAPIARGEVWTSFYSVREFTEKFLAFFSVSQIRALLTLLPPPYFVKKAGQILPFQQNRRPFHGDLQ
jgi:ubiquinone/menaquinone biosynthesis C-methylase UbiE